MVTSYKEYKSELLTEKQKENEDYLIEQVDLAIGELVYDKDYLRKAYNYYNGQRDKDQFKFIEDNYGLGSATSLEFIPLIRSHVDALIGEQLQNKLKPNVTCKDKETLSKINEEKKNKILNAQIEMYKKQLNTNLHHATLPKEQREGMNPPEDKATDEYIDRMTQEMERDFISEYEIAVHYVIKSLLQNKNVDLSSKTKLLYIDLLVAGQCYYKTYVERIGESPKIEVLNPFDVFVEKNPNSMYVKHSSRVVYRRWLNKEQIIGKYGRYMSKEDLDELNTQLGSIATSDVYYVRSSAGGLVANVSVGVDNVNSYNRSMYTSFNLIPVYEVEWIANNEIKDKEGEKDYRKDRYEGIRIGDNIYINLKKSENVVRSIEQPLECNVSVNGITFDERGSTPYSLVLQTANLQDKYDLLHFYRDQLIASSGIKGDFLDIAVLPTFLGENEVERVLKYIAYKKQGIALMDSSQEGAGNLNTIYKGFDNTLSGDAINAITLAIQTTEQTASSITGVFRERLGGIEQRDAVTNVEVGIRQSAIITKQYYHMMDCVTTELLIDAVNMCKISYKEGKMGSIVLGNAKQMIFTIDPTKFSFTDYDISIVPSGDTTRDMETIKMVTLELIKGQAIDGDIALEALTTDSLTEMKDNVTRSIRTRKEENNQLEQAAQQLEQLQQQLQKMQMELTKLGGENEKLKGQIDTNKEKEIMLKYQIDKEKNRIAEEYNEAQIKIDEEKVRIEALQLVDNNPLNNKVNFGK